MPGPVRPLLLLLIPITASLTPACALAADVEPAHAKNDVYQTLQRDGFTLAGTHVAFPAPLLLDGDSSEKERAALRKLAGSDAALAELLRNSVVAPQILKIRDEKTADGTLIRIADLWFAVHARLEEIDPAKMGGKKGQGESVETGNMKIRSVLLSDDELKTRGITGRDPQLEWYSHMTGDLLDRIHVESTDHAQGTKGNDSWVFASRTDPRFDGDKAYPNQWWPIERTAKPKGAPNAAPRGFAGGASTTKISRLASEPGTLFVEGHFAFAEPNAWFDGAPVLRSKISLVAQDQIRRLRRELAQGKPKP
jgi:hypothetical protein